MRAARLAHRDLVASNVILDDSGDPWFVDLAHAVSSASTSAMDNDAAELLVTTSLLVGSERAVAAAVDILGRDGLVGALAEPQPLALTPESRRALAGHPTQLSGLRLVLEAAIGVEPNTADTELNHANPLRAVGVVVLAALVSGALVAVAGPQAVADAWGAISMRWVGVAVLATGVAALAARWAFVASRDRRLAIGRTALVQMHALARSVLVGTGAGGRVMVRYLSRSGVPSGQSLDGIARLRRSRWLMCALAMTAGVMAAWEEKVRFHLAPRFAALAIVAAAAAAFQWRLAERRRPASPPADRRARRLHAPLILVGVGLATGAELASTVAVVSAFGPGPAVGVVVVLAVLASVGPFGSRQGEVGPGSALLVAGLASSGMALPAAVAATLVAKLLQIWAPVVMGRLLARPLSAAVGG